MRLCAVGVLICAVAAATPAIAVDLSGVRCEDKEVIGIIEKNLKSTRFEGGQALGSAGIHVDRVEKSTTSHASRTKLICRVTVRLTAGGQVQSLRGTYTFQEFRSGKLTATWNPVH